jgi:hypothetical protein
VEETGKFAWFLSKFRRFLAAKTLEICSVLTEQKIRSFTRENCF